MLLVALGGTSAQRSAAGRAGSGWPPGALVYLGIVVVVGRVVAWGLLEEKRGHAGAS